MDTDALLTRLDRLESLAEIGRLSIDYCQGADGRDLDLFLSVWANDGVWRVNPETSFEGRAEIARAIARQWDALQRAYHWTSNPLIDTLGESATGRYQVNAEVQDFSGAWTAIRGEYLDTYVRVAGRWRLQKREAVVHSQRPL